MKSLEEKIDNLPIELQAFRDKLLSSRREFVSITLERVEELDFKTSKVGGLPYLPINQEYPTDRKGQALDFLAQINFAEMPRLDNYPTEGILQFYIVADDEYGLGFDDVFDSDTRVIYHENIELDFQKEFAELEAVRENDMYESPIFENRQFKMIFSDVQEESVACYDFHFNRLFNENGWRFFEQFKEKENICRDAYSEYFSAMGHRVGGYGFFTQIDPRYEHDNLNEYTELLFQLDSDYDSAEDRVVWGDAGVANFFIRPNDLKNRDFSKILFNWDCH